MTAQELEKANKLTKEISLLEATLNKFVKSEFDGKERKEVVNDMLSSNDWAFISNDVKEMLTKEECYKINETIYNILCNKIKERQEELEKI